MKHSFAATNPCHVYDLALALFEKEALGTYYSGYPNWRLKTPEGFPIRVRSARTLLTYGLQRFPERLRPDDDRMFRWQDDGFDRAVARVLEGDGYIHGLPGQCLEIFRKAAHGGLIPVLNHASGPLHQQRALIAPEYRRGGIDLAREKPLPKAYEDRLAEEFSLAEVHCVASSVVKEQLVADGISPDRIWVVPYGADAGLFPKRARIPDGPFRICFAGRQSLRKGIHYLLKALELAGEADWELHCFGMPFRESAPDFDSYSGKPRIFQRGSVPQGILARELADMHVLVLPSAEEAFGLVVVQALQVGLPCIVSDRVGAKDLIRDGETGSVVPFGDAEAMGAALANWNRNRVTVEDRFPWDVCAERLLEESVNPLSS